MLSSRCRENSCVRYDDPTFADMRESKRIRGVSYADRWPPIDDCHPRRGARALSRPEARLFPAERIGVPDGNEARRWTCTRPERRPALAGGVCKAENLYAADRPRKRTMLFMAHLVGPRSTDPDGEPDRLCPTDARPADSAGSGPGCYDDHPAAARHRNRTATRVAVHLSLKRLFSVTKAPRCGAKAWPYCHREGEWSMRRWCTAITPWYSRRTRFSAAWVRNGKPPAVSALVPAETTDPHAEKRAFPGCGQRAVRRPCRRHSNRRGFSYPKGDQVASPPTPCTRLISISRRPSCSSFSASSLRSL